ncbi:MAG: DNA-formamidopyrimidine glycosylase family protein [Arhodomonas sp.]|nr:DNA-formamidopyrimidine glycosylase family protein [Arhodomonas sp.]
METTRRGLAPHLEHRRIETLVVRERRLRWPVAEGLEAAVAGRRITSVERRGKYLLIAGVGGERGLLWHLGMSGSLRVLAQPPPPQPHDHVDLRLAGRHLYCASTTHGASAACTSPRPPEQHPLLAGGLGPEPLDSGFDGEWLHPSRPRPPDCRQGLPRWTVLRTVAGLGNIYATEALHRAGIHPSRPAGRIGRGRYHRLAEAVREVLEAAIAAGGTTLRDSTGSAPAAISARTCAPTGVPANRAPIAPSAAATAAHRPARHRLVPALPTPVTVAAQGGHRRHPGLPVGPGLTQAAVTPAPGSGSRRTASSNAEPCRERSDIIEDGLSALTVPLPRGARTAPTPTTTPQPAARAMRRSCRLSPATSTESSETPVAAQKPCTMPGAGLPP